MLVRTGVARFRIAAATLLVAGLPCACFVLIGGLVRRLGLSGFRGSLRLRRLRALAWLDRATLGLRCLYWFRCLGWLGALAALGRFRLVVGDYLSSAGPDRLEDVR